MQTDNFLSKKPIDWLSAKPEIYQNVMESLVADEVAQQMRRLSPRTARYISKQEVIAFVLNRLPTLYATSEKGWHQQRQKGQRDFGYQITSTVQQALAVIQRDPVRLETPLEDINSKEIQAALQGLKTLLKSEKISWTNLPDFVEWALSQSAQGKIVWDQKKKIAGESDAWNNAFYRL